MNTEKSYTLITGATSGVGLELAKNFAKDGKNLIIVARKTKELDQASQILKAEGAPEVITITKDLFNVDNAKALYAHIKEQHLKVDTLVNNAGHGWYGEFKDTELDMELNIINLNISSLVTLTKYFLQDMIENGGGKILNTSSVASKSPGPWQSVYHGTKAFVQSFTEAVRAEVKDHNITVTALLPGPTDTDFFRKANMLESKIVVGGDLADPKDVAKVGYDALKAGKDMVIAGVQNKMQVAMGAVTSDEKLAEQNYKKQAPASEDEKKDKK